MPKISELVQGADVDTPTKETLVLVPVVQNGATRYLLLSQALAARLPVGTPLDGLAEISPTGAGFPYRDALGVWTISALPGSGVWDPAGAAAAAVGSHNSDAAAHGGVSNLVSAHVGAGGTAHALAAVGLRGFMPALSGDSATYLDGNGGFSTPQARTNALVETVTANATLSPNPTRDKFFVGDASGGNVTITLNAISSGDNGLRLTFKRKNSSGGTFGISAPSNSFDGGGTSVLIGYGTPLEYMAVYNSTTPSQSYWARLSA